ncbi:acyltransferase family protein [Aquihabitans sp. McL0605]|uniref:acyltransferase family protein n=1 Tax=Aquihabitans sp. McL0605 TaxID=3415671 RepID=UPI003CF779A0
MSSSPDQPSTGSARLACVDQMRGLAALYVALYHALLVQWPNGEARPAWYLRWADFGHVAVAIFIVLSGYSLALGIARRSDRSAGPYGRFMAKRAYRLLPPYWVALFGSILLLALAPHSSRPSAATAADTWSKGPVPFRSIPVFGLLLQDVFRVPSPNSPLWSIAVEWHLYFIFPVLILLGVRYGMGRLVAAGLVVGVGLHVAVVNTSLAATTPHFLALFCFGIASAFAVAGRTASGRAGPAGPRVGWAMMGLAFGAFVLFHQWEVIGDVLAGALVAGALFVLGTAAERPAPAGRERFRWLASVGLISYSLYLIHSPTEKVVWELFVSKLGLAPVPAFAVLAVLGIGASLLAARLLFVLVEQPSLRRAHQVGAPPPKVAPSTSWGPAPSWLGGRGAGRRRQRPAPPQGPEQGLA